MTPTPEEPLLTNERAEREWLYLCRRVGPEEAKAAIGKLKGRQRAYPLNIAKVLGIRLPEEAQLPLTEAQQKARRAGTDQAARSIGEMRKLLR